MDRLRGTRPVTEPLPREVVDRARDGDRAALEQVLRHHAPAVHAICTRICGPGADGEDAAQDALVAIARGMRGFDGRSALSTWVHRVTTNACIDEVRRRRRRPEPVDTTDAQEPVSQGRGPEDSAVAAEAQQRVTAALAELPEEFRAAVVLRDVADLDYRSISDILGVPVGTVRSRIARGRARLAGALDPQTGTESPADTSEGTGR